MKILSIQKNSSLHVCLVFINKTETRQKDSWVLFFFFPSKELRIVFLKVNSLFSLTKWESLTPQRRVLSPTVKLLKHVGNVMFAVF